MNVVTRLREFAKRYVKSRAGPPHRVADLLRSPSLVLIGNFALMLYEVVLDISRISGIIQFPFIAFSILLGIGLSSLLWTTSSLGSLSFIPITMILSLVVGFRFFIVNRRQGKNPWNRSMKLVALLAFMGVLIFTAGGYAECVAGELAWERYGLKFIVDSFGGGIDVGPIPNPSDMELMYSRLGNILCWGGLLISISGMLIIKRYDKMKSESQEPPAEEI